MVIFIRWAFSLLTLITPPCRLMTILARETSPRSVLCVAVFRGGVQSKGIEEMLQVLLGKLGAGYTIVTVTWVPFFRVTYFQLAFPSHLVPGVFHQVGQRVLQQIRIQGYWIQAADPGWF